MSNNLERSDIYMYRGNHGIKGAIAFGLVGILYKIFGVSSKLFGKVFFAIFLLLIPMIFKAIIKILFN